MDLLVSGNTVVRRLTVPEGLTVAQVLAQLGAIPTFSIDGCGHFVMTEKPEELARITWSVISRAGPPDVRRRD